MPIWYVRQWFEMEAAVKVSYESSDSVVASGRDGQDRVLLPVAVLCEKSLMRQQPQWGMCSNEQAMSVFACIIKLHSCIHKNIATSIKRDPLNAQSV